MIRTPIRCRNFKAELWVVFNLALLMPAAANASGLPLLRTLFGRVTFGEARFRETVNKLNQSRRYDFTEAYKTEQTLAFYSARERHACWFKHFASDELAEKLARELGEYNNAFFRYGNWLGYCTSGETQKLSYEVRSLLKDAGELRE